MRREARTCTIFQKEVSDASSFGVRRRVWQAQSHPLKNLYLQFLLLLVLVWYQCFRHLCLGLNLLHLCGLLTLWQTYITHQF